MGELDCYLRIETVGSVPGMAQFAEAALSTSNLQSWSVIATAKMCSLARSDSKLADWATEQARRNICCDDDSEALMRYVLHDDAAWGMALPGAVGHWLAIQEANCGYRLRDLSRMEPAQIRLWQLPADYNSEDQHAAAIACTCLYDILGDSLKDGGLQRSRTQEALAKFTPWQRQIFMLYFMWLYQGFSMGGRT